MALRERTKIARKLRHDPTEAESRLWRLLRETFPAKRFRRQHPIGRYVVDFACPAHKLAIEIDGGQHAVQQPADLARTEEIARHGYRVVRFWNNEVLQNLPGVLQAIEQELAADDRIASGYRRGAALSAPRGGEGERRPCSTNCPRS